MFAATNTLDGKQGFQEAYERIRDITSRLNNHLSIFWAPKIIVSMLKIKKKARKLRDIMLICEEKCDSFPRCFNKDYYPFSKMVRDEHIKLLDSINASNPLFLRKTFAYFVEDSLIEWDELTEDCLIGADNEIRNLVESIAERV